MKKLFALFSLASVLLSSGAYAENTTNSTSQPSTTVSQPSVNNSHPGYNQNAPIDHPNYVMHQDAQEQSFAGYHDGSFQGSYQGEFAQDGGTLAGVSQEGASYQDTNSNCQDNGTVDVPTGDCYCKRVCYKTCYCKVPRCEYVTKCYQKRHCRWVCQQYEKPCVKYVPVCTTETRSRYVPEYYYTTETRQVPVWSCAIVEKQVPRYYYQHVCQPECGPEAQAPAAQDCCQ